MDTNDRTEEKLELLYQQLKVEKANYLVRLSTCKFSDRVTTFDLILEDDGCLKMSALDFNHLGHATSQIDSCELEVDDLIRLVDRAIIHQRYSEKLKPKNLREHKETSKKWYTPSYENPLDYHIRRLEAERKLINETETFDWTISFDSYCEKYIPVQTKDTIIGAKYTTKRIAKKITKALNKGKIQI